MPGPRPEPTALKILKGNPGHRRLNIDEPQGTIITKLPNAPRALSERAGKVWREYGNELIVAGLLTALRLNGLYRYCIAFDLYEKSRELVEKSGPVLVNGSGGGPFIHPAVNIMSMTSKEMHRIECEFGMTPASATRVRSLNPKQMDLFDDFLDEIDGHSGIVAR